MELLDLWLPALLSAVFVFLASSVIHMALPIHKSDSLKLPDEAKVLDAMRSARLAPGQYMFPRPTSMKDMGSPEMLERFRQGPVGSLIVIPNGAPAIGRSLVQWFLFSIAISVFVAYAGALCLPAGTAGMTVFRVASSIALLGYGVSHVQDSIWKGLSWRVSLKFVFDGLIYALVTGLTFAWLWPAAA